MALRPGSRLLMSSHFIPLPRNSMINASSSGDHFDCFFAGDSAVWAGWRRFVGTDGEILAERGGSEAKGAGATAGAVVVGGPKTGLDGRLDAVVTGVASSSSSGFKSNEISTLAGGSIAWFCVTIICAFRSGIDFVLPRRYWSDEGNHTWNAVTLCDAKKQGLWINPSRSEEGTRQVGVSWVDNLAASDLYPESSEREQHPKTLKRKRKAGH